MGENHGQGARIGKGWVTLMSKPIHVLDGYIGETAMEDALDRSNSIGVLSCLVDETLKCEGECVADRTTLMDCMFKRLIMTNEIKHAERKTDYAYQVQSMVSKS